MPIVWGDPVPVTTAPITWDGTSWRDVSLSIGGDDTANLRAALRKAGPPTASRTWQDDWAASPMWDLLTGGFTHVPADVAADVKYWLGADGQPYAPSWWDRYGIYAAAGAGLLLAALAVKRAR